MLRHIKLLIVCSSIFIVFPSSVYSTYNLKQECDVGTSANRYITTGQWPGVRLKATSNYRLDRVGFEMIKSGSPTCKLTVLVFDSTATWNSPITVYGVSETVLSSDLPTSSDWVYFDMILRPNIVQDNYYSIQIIGGDGVCSTSTNIARYYYNPSGWDACANNLYSLYSGSWSGNDDTQDGSIRTYEDDDYPPPTPTPIPGGSNFTDFDFSTSSAEAISDDINLLYYSFIIILFGISFLVGYSFLKK